MMVYQQVDLLHQSDLQHECGKKNGGTDSISILLLQASLNIGFLKTGGCWNV